MEIKKLQILKTKQDRERTLKNLSTSYLSENENDLKDKFNIPSYMRKNVQLKEDTHSSDKKLSKFSIDEEGHIIKNNKFFDEKPD